MKEVGDNYDCSVVPDLSLYTDLRRYVSDTSNKRSNDNVVVFDSVLPQVSNFIYKNYSNLPDHEMLVFSEINDFYRSIYIRRHKRIFGKAKELTINNLSKVINSRYIISGRFHGLCLSILAQVPFIAFTSNSYKVEGMLCDIFGERFSKNLILNSDEFTIDNVNDSIYFIRENEVEINKKIYEYKSTATSKIEEMFVYIKNL